MKFAHRFRNVTDFVVSARVENENVGIDIQ